MARYSLSPSDLPTSTADIKFWTKLAIPPLCWSALSCEKSSNHLRVKQWASVMWVSWMQMMSTRSLFRNSCSSGFFFSVRQHFTVGRHAGQLMFLDDSIGCLFVAFSFLRDSNYQLQQVGPFEAGGPALSPPGVPLDKHNTTVCQSTWPCWVECVVIDLFLVLSLCRRSACCPQPTLPTSEQLLVWAWSTLLLDWWLPPAISSISLTSCPWLGVHLAVGSRGSPPPWLLAAFSSSSAPHKV